MNTRTFALIWGIAFLLAGASGFIPGLTTPPHPNHPDLVVDAFYGQALGLFPVNILHNIVHLLFGVWGLLAYKSLSASKGFAKSVAIIYAVLVVAGLIPGLNTMFGLVPLFGNDVWLHILLAAPAAYFGWMHRDTTTGDRT
jgi:predicted small secreted protein